VYVRAFDASVTLRVAGYDDSGIWPFSTASQRTSGGRRLRRIGIVALARKLLIALLHYVEHGEIPEGAEDTKLRRPEIFWKQIAGMRDKVIHDYFGVNFEIVWAVVQNDLPKLSVAVMLF
jgi:hypothetical protein